MNNNDLTPRAYQRQAIDWVKARKKCLVALPTGTGKTMVSINSVVESGALPCLVVCPAILRENWKREILMWDPHAKVQVIKKGSDAVDPAAEWIVINYDLLWKHADALSQRGLVSVVFDEASALKGRTTKRTRAARALAMGIPMRVLMTATPVLNRPSELGSLLSVMGELHRWGGWESFVKRFCDPKRRTLYPSRRTFWDISGSSNLDELRRDMQPIMLRRSKEELLPELPPVTMVDQFIDLSNRGEYDAAAADVKKWLVEKALAKGDETNETAVALAAALALEDNGAEAMVQLTACRRLVAEGKVEGAAEWVKGWLEENPGASLVVFGHHRDGLQTLTDKLNGAGIVTRCIMGGQTETDRQAKVDDFQAKQVQVLVCGIKAAGVGLTLTAASTCLFLEETWTPADTDQAIGRLVRIGQAADKVLVYKLVAPRTVDMSVRGALEKKAAIIQRIVG